MVLNSYRLIVLATIFVQAQIPAMAAAAPGESAIEIEPALFNVPSRLSLGPVGFLQWRRLPGPVDETERLIVFGVDGSRLASSSLAIPGAVSLSVVSACFLPVGDSRIAVTVGFSSADGALAHGVALLGADGRVNRFLRTDQFVGDHVACDKDGNIWVFGRPYEWHSTTTYSTVLKMTQTGDLLGSYLPRDSYDLEPSQIPSMPAKPGGGITQFVASGNRIVLYAAVASELIELDLEGKVLGRHYTPGFEVSGLAVGTGGEIYATVNGDGSALFRFDAVQARWAAVAEWNTVGHSLWHLAGAMGSRLVFQETNPARFLSIAAP
jgi:hypothetical protein